MPGGTGPHRPSFAHLPRANQASSRCGGARSPEGTEPPRAHRRRPAGRDLVPPRPAPASCLA
eukprot:5981809-Alexandrium_andersonii.AAC.1